LLSLIEIASKRLAALAPDGACAELFGGSVNVRARMTTMTRHCAM
jgi:hypothetical protein